MGRQQAWMLAGLVLACSERKLPDDDLELELRTDSNSDSDDAAGGDDSSSTEASPWTGDQELGVALEVTPSHGDPDARFCGGSFFWTVEPDGSFAGSGDCSWGWSPPKPGFLFEAFGVVGDDGAVDGTILAARTDVPDTWVEYPLSGTLTDAVDVFWYGEAILVADDPTNYLGEIYAR